MVVMVHPDLEDVGRYVQVLRAELGISQAELATRAGVDKGTISRLETGHSWPWATKRALIEKALGLNPGQLARVRKEARAAAAVVNLPEEIAPQDVYEETIVASELSYPEKVAAVRRHRAQTRSLMTSLGIDPPPELLRRAVRRYADETEGASDAERRRGA
jgi:transcriptional regulator with XRE-family HTH domain